jgi:alcohol dehydrogenase YqhD (iron-dependent ADH family)
MEFNFSTANEIHFGPGIARSLSDFLPDQSRRCFVLTGSSPERHREVMNNLSNKGKQVETASVVSEPNVETINSLVRQ